MTKLYLDYFESAWTQIMNENGVVALSYLLLQRMFSRGSWILGYFNNTLFIYNLHMVYGKKKSTIILFNNNPIVL